MIEVATPSDGFDSDVWRAAVEALVRERAPQAVLVAHSVDGMSFGPAVAAALGRAWPPTWSRWPPRATVSLPPGRRTAARSPWPSRCPRAASSRCVAATFPAAAPGGSPQRTTFACPPVTSRLAHRGYVEQPAGEVDITGAEVIVSIGRGIGEQDNIELFERVAARLGATLASSRPLVDAGWMPHERQVGQSGTTVKPSVYLAFGISGAVQHLAGMKAARTIIAVNTDAQAPIFGVAHYGSTVDALDVAEAIADA